MTGCTSALYTTIIRQKIYLFASAACSMTPFHATAVSSEYLNNSVRLEPRCYSSLKPFGDRRVADMDRTERLRCGRHTYSRGLPSSRDGNCRLLLAFFMLVSLAHLQLPLHCRSRANHMHCLNRCWGGQHSKRRDLVRRCRQSLDRPRPFCFWI